MEKEEEMEQQIYVKYYAKLHLQIEIVKENQSLFFKQNNMGSKREEFEHLHILINLTRE